MGMKHHKNLKIFPTSEQWNKWSIPSKLTAIGTYVGIISLLIYVSSLVINFLLEPKEKNERFKIAITTKTNDYDFVVNENISFKLEVVLSTSKNTIIKDAFVVYDFYEFDEYLNEFNKLNPDDIIYYFSLQEKSLPISVLDRSNNKQIIILDLICHFSGKYKCVLNLYSSADVLA